MSEDNTLKHVNTGANYNISPDQFEKVIAELPEEQADILRWWYFHGKDNNYSLSQLATSCGTSSTTLSRIFRGNYGAELTSICEKLTKARETMGLRVDNPDFIETSLSRKMFGIFDRTRALCTVSLMWGDMGGGKTTCSEEYRRQNNHGRTCYVRCGARMNFAQFVVHVAKAIGVTTKNRGQAEVRYKIQSLLRSGQRLLIIDELHLLFIATRGNTAVDICEFLRECYDVSGCGMVLIGTKVLKKEFLSGVHKEALAQLLDRGTIQVDLPSKPTAADARAFVKRYGLPPLDESEPEACAIIADLLKTSGLRKLTLHLRDGAAYALARRQPFAWSHFVQAFDDIQSLTK